MKRRTFLRAGLASTATILSPALGSAWAQVKDKDQQVVVANCQYYGGGMRIAPAALPDDGMLDLVIVGDVGRLENVRLMGKVREGAHLPHPKMEHRLVRRVIEHNLRIAAP